MLLKFLSKKVGFLIDSMKTGVNKDDVVLKDISKDLDKSVEGILNKLGNSADVKTHSFYMERSGKKGALVFVDGLVNLELITHSILSPILSYSPVNDDEFSIAELKSTILTSGDIVEASQEKVVVEGIISGSTALLIEGEKTALIVGTKGWDKRSVTEPQTEAVVRGPREGFTENFRTNTALIRRRLKTDKLRLENMIIGRKTRTDVAIAYIEGVADPEVVDTVRARLKALKVDSVLDSSYLEEYIEDAPFSIFATVGSTEKPDVVAGKLLEGRIAIISDGSPFVLTAPMLYIESFQTAEDYYLRPFYATITRFLRFLAYFIAIFAVPMFIAFTTFHQEFIPTTLLLTIANAREGTPFPVLLEAFIMVLAFEILREAGLRLPRPVGQSISIVGALVMGDAAVSAGIVGTPIVITVAIAAVAGFTVPTQTDAISMLRIIMMPIAAFLGGFGLAIGVLGLAIHLATLHSFGVQYFGAVKPDYEQQDTFVRMPLWSMKKRPNHIASQDIQRKEVFIPPIEQSEEKNEK